jgi:hypothetical protein
MLLIIMKLKCKNNFNNLDYHRLTYAMVNLHFYKYWSSIYIL